MAEEGTHQSGVLRELLAVFGFGVDTKELKDGESSLDSFFKSVKKIAAAIAGVFAVRAIDSFVESNVAAMSQIERTSEQLGISTDQVQIAQLAAKSLGLEQDGLLNSMGRLQIAQQAAAAGAEQQSKAFKSIGVSVKDASGHMKSADVLFADVAEGVSKVTDPSKQAAVAVHLFGRSGRGLLPILKQGKKGIAEFAESFKELGGGYTKEAIEQSREFEKQSARLSLGFTGLKNVVMRALLPPITWLVERMTDAVKWIREMTKSSYIVEAALGLMGAAAGVFAIEMALANLPILVVTAAIAGLVAIVDDFMVMMAGGESVIGDTIDKIFGKGASAQYVKDVRDAYRDIVNYLREAYGYVERVLTGKESSGLNVGGSKSDSAAQTAAEVEQRARQRGAGIGIAGDQGAQFSDADPSAWTSRMLRGLGVSDPTWVGRPPTPQISPAAAQAFAGPASMEFNFTVPPNLTTPEGAALVGEHVREALKQERREAAANLPRKAPAS